MEAEEVAAALLQDLPFRANVSLIDYKRQVIVAALNDDGTPALREARFSVQIMKDRSQRALVVAELELQYEYRL